MIYYDDPLNGGDIEITDVASASYALKLANDDYFGVYWQNQEMLKELSRLDGEIYNQKYALIEPYLPHDSDGNVAGAGIIPNPLPATVPQRVIAAMNYLDAQYSIAEQRYQAELAENTSELKEVRTSLESKVAEWFRGEIGKAWLGGRRKVTLSGCEMSYINGRVVFNYTELSYD